MVKNYNIILIMLSVFVNIFIFEMSVFFNICIEYFLILNILKIYFDNIFDTWNEYFWCTIYFKSIKY